MQDLLNWRVEAFHQFSLESARERGLSDPMLAIPPGFRGPVRLTVAALIHDMTDEDFEEALFYYRDLREEDEGPPPYLRRVDYDDRWALHPLTLFVIDSRYYELQLVELRSPTDAPYYSVFAEVYGYLVHDGRLVAINEQGSFGAKGAAIDPPVLEDIWSFLVRRDAEPQTLADALAGPMGDWPRARRIKAALGLAEPEHRG